MFKYLKYVSNISNQHNLHKLRDKSKCTFAESKPIRENFTDNDTAVFEVVYIACNSKALRTRKKKNVRNGTHHKVPSIPMSLKTATY